MEAETHKPIRPQNRSVGSCRINDLSWNEGRWGDASPARTVLASRLGRQLLFLKKDGANTFSSNVLFPDVLDRARRRHRLFIDSTLSFVIRIYSFMMAKLYPGRLDNRCPSQPPPRSAPTISRTAALRACVKNKIRKNSASLFEL